MLTGTIPPYHGVHDNSGYQLDQSNVTLAEILKQSGFTTGGIISALVLDSEFDIDQGFDTYSDQFEEEREATGDITERIGAETSRFAITWLQQHKDEKFFLFLHYFDPHGDYVPPEPFASKFADNLYAGEIAYTDHCIGLVLSKLKELGLYESTLTIITSDHGEMLGEHGEPSHSYFIYQSAIKVPLIFRLPGKAKSRRIKGIVGLVDIAPTICSLLGIEVPSQIQGMDLSACIKGYRPEEHDRHIFCECFTATHYNGNSLLGVVTDRWKYIQTTHPELYDLVKDPHETKNLINQQPHQGRILQDRLKQMLERAVRNDKLNDKIVLDNESRERLESLGYVAGGIIEDFNFDQTRDDPKDLINFHNANLKVVPLLAQEMYDQAKTVAEKLVHERPDCHVGYKHLARIARKQKDYSTDAFYLKKSLELNPDDYKTHTNLGSTLASLGKFDEAISHFRESLRIAPNNAEAHNNLGGALAKQGKLDEAIKHFREALFLDPDNSAAHLNLGNTIALQGNLEEAAAHLTQAIRLNPNSASAHENLAKLVTGLNDPDAAIRHLTEAIRLNPNIDLTHFNLAHALNSKGRTEGAITHFREALRIKPNWEKPMNSLAWILATHSQDNLRNPAEAIQLAERACELANQKNAGFLDTLAAAYAAAGRYDDAVATAEKAVRLTASDDNKQRHDTIKSRLQLYKSHQPYRR
jgi:arylsulfatase A-like enzyme/Flp pilus assembly protein TadD